MTSDDVNDACIHGPGVAHCGHPDCVGDREFARRSPRSPRSEDTAMTAELPGFPELLAVLDGDVKTAAWNVVDMATSFYDTPLTDEQRDVISIGMDAGMAGLLHTLAARGWLNDEAIRRDVVPPGADG